MGFPAFNLTLGQLADSRHVIAGTLSNAARSDLSRWQNMPEQLREGVLDEMRSYQPLSKGSLDGPCSWLDISTRRCSHHEHRPQVCRDFEVGGRGCQQWRRELSDRIEDG